IHGQFVEVYFLGYQETSLNLDDFRIVVDGMAAQACELTDGVVDESNRFFLVQRGPAPCLNDGACAHSCQFPSIGTDVEVRLEMKVGGTTYVEIDSQQSSEQALS